VPQHQSDLLFPLWPEHDQRLCYLPLARQGPPQRAGLLPTAHHTDLHVLAWRHVNLSLLSGSIHTNKRQCMHRRRRATLLHASIPHVLRRLLSVPQSPIFQSFLTVHRARGIHLHNHVRRVRRRRRLRLSPRLQTAHEPHVPTRLRQHLPGKLVPAPLCRRPGSRRQETRSLGLFGRRGLVPHAIPALKWAG